MIFEGPIYIHSTAPLSKRVQSRKVVGPYQWIPDDVDKWLTLYGRPSRGRGFYQSSNSLSCGDSTFRLRLSLANDHLTGSRLSAITGYYCDEDGGDTLQPIVARLPHGKGYLAGWTMGRGMCAALDLDIYDTIEAAARAAHQKAEYVAEENRRANAKWQEEEQEREQAEIAEDHYQAEQEAVEEHVFNTHSEVIQ